MQITHEKYKQELSNFYKIGYATSFKDIIVNIKEFAKDKAPLFQRQCEDLISELFVKYNSYPCIIPEVEKELE